MGLEKNKLFEERSQQQTGLRLEDLCNTTIKIILKITENKSVPKEESTQ